MDVFDRKHFAHMTGDDAALQREIAGLFRGQIAAWRTAFKPGADWRDAAHTLKGSARGIGLWVLAEACESAEKAPGDANAALVRLNAALDEALTALDAAYPA